MTTSVSSFVAAVLMAAAALAPNTATATHVEESPPGPLAVAPVAQEVLDVVQAVGSSRRFLERHVLDDGRVVRWDHGGDTVSEGQAYAMLVAAAIGDEPTFRNVWEWTERELGRDDGAFAWRWADGRVIDEEPAADADLYIAGALSLAARRFGEPTYRDAARRVGDAIVRTTTVRFGDDLVLAAGPWATDSGLVNPSYWAVPLMSRLWWDGGWSWGSVAAGSRLAATQLTDDAPHLPPDWATIETNGNGDPTATPSGVAPRYGWEAVRVPVQFAADCTENGRRIAARMWPFFLANDVQVASVVELDGTVVDPAPHAAAFVGAAGAAMAAGAAKSARILLDQADTRNVAHPTYYGEAWTAIGRLWLTTSMLGGCAGE